MMAASQGLPNLDLDLDAKNIITDFFKNRKRKATSDASQVYELKCKIYKDENQSDLNDEKENQPEPGTGQSVDSSEHNIQEEVSPDNANSEKEEVSPDNANSEKEEVSSDNANSEKEEGSSDNANSEKEEVSSDNVNSDSTDACDADESQCCKFVLESSKLRYSICKKNPRHLAYIPVGDFSHTDLPEPYRDSMFDDLVKYLSDLVVKINVNYISPERHEQFAEKPTKHKSATAPLIIGSGKVIFAEFTKPKFFHYHKEPTLIRIVTACHVVFDEEEAKSTTCDLFYDKEDAKCATLTGYHVENSNVDEDVTVFVCSTDDWSLIDLLRDTIYKYREVHDILHETYKQMENNNLVLCVSHPHGHAKQVSLGRYIKREILESGPRKGSNYTKYHYEVSTCDGSSGAPLCIISKKDSWIHHPHTASRGKIGISGIEWEKECEPFPKKEHQ